MAEVGLLPFARVAWQVATRVLPPYRTRFSKHQFTQPQLLAVLCLMRYEDWTFREAEVRLREHSELRAVLRLSSVPDYTTVYRFLRRLPDDTMERALGESVRRLRRSSRRGRRRAGVAHFLKHFFQPCDGPAAADDYGAALGEIDGQLLADAVGRAGDQDDLAIKFHGS